MELTLDFTTVLQEAEKGEFDTLFNALKQAHDNQSIIYEIDRVRSTSVAIPRKEGVSFPFLEQKKNHRYLLKRIVQEKQLNILRLMWLYNEAFMAGWVDVMNEFTFSHNNTDFYKRKFDILEERLGKRPCIIDALHLKANAIE